MKYREWIADQDWPAEPYERWYFRCLEIAREVLPGWNDDALGYALWNETGFPCFWHGEPEVSLREQLEDFKANGPLDINFNRPGIPIHFPDQKT